MSRRFEELANSPTPIGTLSLWRRLEPSLRIDVDEVRLGDEYLVTSPFTVGEEALAELGLAATAGDHLDGPAHPWPGRERRLPGADLT